MSQSDDSLTFSIHACYLSTKLSGANDLCVYTSIFFVYIDANLDGLHL